MGVRWISHFVPKDFEHRPRNRGVHLPLGQAASRIQPLGAKLPNLRVGSLQLLDWGRLAIRKISGQGCESKCLGTRWQQRVGWARGEPKCSVDEAGQKAFNDTRGRAPRSRRAGGTAVVWSSFCLSASRGLSVCCLPRGLRKAGTKTSIYARLGSPNKGGAKLAWRRVSKLAQSTSIYARLGWPNKCGTKLAWRPVSKLAQSTSIYARLGWPNKGGAKLAWRPVSKLAQSWLKSSRDRQTIFWSRAPQRSMAG